MWETGFFNWRMAATIFTVLILSCNPLFPTSFMLTLGAAVLIDDGMVETDVCGVYPEGVMLEVKHILREHSIRLRAEKGLTFLHRIKLSPFLPKRSEGISALCCRARWYYRCHLCMHRISDNSRSADCIGPQSALSIVAKIETVEGANHLPEIIVAGAAKSFWHYDCPRWFGCWSWLYAVVRVTRANSLALWSGTGASGMGDRDLI